MWVGAERAATSGIRMKALNASDIIRAQLLPDDRRNARLPACASASPEPSGYVQNATLEVTFAHALLEFP